MSLGSSLASSFAVVVTIISQLHLRLHSDVSVAPDCVAASTEEVAVCEPCEVTVNEAGWSTAASGVAAGAAIWGGLGVYARERQPPRLAVRRVQLRP